MQLLSEADQFVGNYVSKEWIWKNILRMSDEDVDKMKKEMEGEEAEAPDDEEKAPPAEQKPVPVQVVPQEEKPPKEETPKKEGYIHTQEDELIESMTRFMDKLNGDN
jgi:hypothetical protein